MSPAGAERTVAVPESPAIRPMEPTDRGWVLALGRAHEVETGPLDERRLEAMRVAAFRAEVAGTSDGYLIAFDQDGVYDSINFRWFQAAYDRFVYVDRIVVAPPARGRGLARAFYARLFAAARAAGQVRVVCEVNEVPPNPASLALHAALGFEPVGRATLAGGKTVVYLARWLAPV